MDFRRIRLSNGLRVVLVPQEGSTAATISLTVEAGSKYETKDINGISHFLEHMCFKGTTNRPRAIDIAGELDGLGAKYNAFTAQEYTSYYAKVKSEFLEQAVDVVSDLYLNQIFDPAEIEKEKGVIIEEINMYEDLPQRRVQELFMEVVYGDQPVGWSIAGRKEVIKKLSKEEFIKYRREHYVPQATVVVIAGNFNEAVVLRQIKKIFSNLKKSRKTIKLEVKNGQTRQRELVRFKKSDQTHLVLGFRAFSLLDERRFALNVLTDILGGGMSSRLFQRIREEMGAAYYVNASADLYSDHGVVAMAAGVQHEKLEKVIKAALEEFARFKDERVNAPDLRRAKDHILGNLFLSLETSDEIGYFYALQEILSMKILTPDLIAKKIEAIKADDIQAVAKALFRSPKMNLALIGPFKNKSFIPHLLHID